MSKSYEDVFREFSENTSLSKKILSILDEELSMPNLKMPTMGGHVFWNTLVEYNGWKLQQNDITHHARILDEDDCRIAWGTIGGMEKALDRMVRLLNKYNDNSANSDWNDELRKLKELYDDDIITSEEFKQKKEKILSRV